MGKFGKEFTHYRDKVILLYDSADKEQSLSNLVYWFLRDSFNLEIELGFDNTLIVRVEDSFLWKKEANYVQRYRMI